MHDKGSIHIGTSGWHYQHWKGTFYPDDTAEKDFIKEYIKHFETAEINNSFYSLPQSETMVKWQKSVPVGFIFSVKASRYITHMKKLKDPLEPVNRFIDRIRLLEEKLGPILFQLPPKWKINTDRLQRFISILPDNYRYAFEFRDPSWFAKQTEEVLRKAGASFCIYDFERKQSPRMVTADFVYIRLHGPDGAYTGKYSDRELSEWADMISTFSNEGKEIFCYFDNDEKGYAPQNALGLKSILNNGGGNNA
jgi:uncharacterized protein YecE (DUF72 family)